MRGHKRSETCTVFESFHIKTYSQHTKGLLSEITCYDRNGDIVGLLKFYRPGADLPMNVESPANGPVLCFGLESLAMIQALLFSAPRMDVRYDPETKLGLVCTHGPVPIKG